MSRPSQSAATLWSAVDVLLRQGLQFGVSVFLARLLSPEAFGTLALVTTMTALAGVFVESGLSAALIQKQDASKEDESSVFWFNLAISILFAIFLSLSAPTIAVLFRAPDMSAVVTAMSLVLVINAAGTVQVTLLAKQMQFKPQAQIGVASLVVSGTVGVGLASAGLEVWALVGQALSSAVVTTILLWTMSTWRPALVFRVASIRTLLGFGSYMLLASLVDTMAARASAFAVGWFHTARDLGYYARAETTALVAPSVLQRIVPRVAFSSYSEVASDAQRLRKGVTQSLRALSTIAVPMMIGISAIAEPLVLSLFGPKWSSAIPMLRVLALTGLAVPYQIVNLSALMALGRSDVLFWLHVAKKAISLVFVAIAATMDPMAMAWAVLAGSIVTTLFDATVPGRYTGYSCFDQARDGWRVYLAGLVMGGAVFGFVEFTTLGAVPTFCLGLPLGAGVYVCLVVALRAHPAVDWLRTAVNRVRQSQRAVS